MLIEALHVEMDLHQSPWLLFLQRLHHGFLFSREIYRDFIFSRELHYDFFFSKEIHCDFLVNPILDNIPETPARISIMIPGVVIPGVVILTIDFSSKLIFARELVILRKSDKLFLHNEFLSLCHIGCILGLRIKGL